MIYIKSNVGLSYAKMSFNPDPSKQAQKIIFVEKLYHISSCFNKNQCLENPNEKHLAYNSSWLINFCEIIKSI